MKNFLKRLGGRAQPVDPVPTESNSYTVEYLEAVDRTDVLGLSVPPVRLLVSKDCVRLDVVTPLIQEYLGGFTADEALGQAFSINTNLIPYLYEGTGIPFTLTLGWFEHMGRELYRHSEQMLRTMLRDGVAAWGADGLPLHVWLTSPACEVLDVTLPTTIAAVSGAKELAGGIIYIPNRNADPPVIYHPTIVGTEFLDKIGATLDLGPRPDDGIGLRTPGQPRGSARGSG